MSSYWLVSATRMRAQVRTTINGIVIADRARLVSPEIGCGWERTARSGFCVGAELTTGGGTRAGPRVLGTVFVTWGPPRR